MFGMSFFRLTGFVLYRLPLNAILFDQLVEHPDGRRASSLFVPVTRMRPTLSFLWGFIFVNYGKLAECPAVRVLHSYKGHSFLFGPL